MEIILLGISHKTAPIRVREKYSLSYKMISEFLTKLSCNKTISESVILSTCNRTEIYIVTNFVDGAREFLYKEWQIPVKNGELQYFYFLQNKDVIKHIFRVASGLDSQVIGENQILGQVKNAYFQAKDSGMTSKYLNKLFQKAIEVGKDIRTKTKISNGNISIASVALKTAENLLGTLEGKNILIIGTGKIGELVSKYLLDKEVQTTFVANRTYEKAIELAKKNRGKAIRFDSLKNELKTADIVISATSSPHLILRKDDILEAINYKLSTINHKLIIMDLALPRDVDPGIKSLPGVVLYNLDDFNLIIEENYRKKLEEAKKAEKIIEKEVEEFWKCINRQLLTVNYQLLELGLGQVHLL